MISRSIMLNPKIPVESKAIYSILAVFAGDKDRCFPTIKTLVEATGISKDRLYKYLNILCDSGIVERLLFCIESQSSQIRRCSIPESQRCHTI